MTKNKKDFSNQNFTSDNVENLTSKSLPKLSPVPKRIKKKIKETIDLLFNKKQ